jgi:PIN domain nuclease of toxin-antitoxin system
LIVALLLDTHILLGLFDEEPTDFGDLSLMVSVASLWEIAIKVRIGKLDLGFPIDDLADFTTSLGCTLLPISVAHVMADVVPWPSTKDPFDRLLLAVCDVESLKLVTKDRSLASHPLAWHPSPA